MKVLVLRTYTGCEPIYKSLECAGHELLVHRYDDRPYDQQDYFVQLAKSLDYDFCVYIGAPEPYHGKPTLQSDILCRLKEIKPIVHLCGDAADDPWWPLLYEYDRKDCFTVQVSFDGSVYNPIKEFKNGLLLLTPVDIRPYAPIKWQERTIRIGYAGSIGGNTRAEILSELFKKTSVVYYYKPGVFYNQYAEFLCGVKVVPNVSYTGTHRAMQVKGRVLEAAFAGCCVFELKGSPTYNWFYPGIDYYEYQTADDIINTVNNTPDDLLETVAINLQRRIFVEHHPIVFWNKVIEKAGLK